VRPTTPPELYVVIHYRKGITEIVGYNAETTTRLLEDAARICPGGDGPWFTRSVAGGVREWSSDELAQLQWTMDDGGRLVCLDGSTGRVHVFFSTREGKEWALLDAYSLDNDWTAKGLRVKGDMLITHKGHLFVPIQGRTDRCEIRAYFQ
jgi:hypothetical protein